MRAATTSFMQACTSSYYSLTLLSIQVGKKYTPAQWVVDAMEKYGDKFMAVYRWDEAGGDQLDNSRYQEVKSASSYTYAAERYVDVLKEIEYYQNAGIDVLTADYGLHWFDYQVGYDAVLAEFGWNNSREQQIALVGGHERSIGIGVR